MDDLASPRLKLDRAEEHYRAFDEILTAFRELHPYATYRERDPHSGLEMLKLKLIGRPRPDPRWGTIIGDFASNLRGALDHLVWAMSVATQKPHRVEFPIEGSLAEFKAKSALQIGAIPPDAQDIIEGLQPYKQGGILDEQPLWRIKRLANADKHRTVTVITSGLHYRFGTVLPGPSEMFIPIPDDVQVDPTVPEPHRAARQPGFYSGSHFDVRAAFAVVTTDGLHVPLEQLRDLHEFVKTKVFSMFPDRFFPKR